MGNSASALAGAVEQVMVEGDVSDLADDAWEAILGGGDQPPMSPADVRAIFSDDLLRAARAHKPKNLLAVVLRALERAEAALEPDAPKEGALALGATVAPADAPTVLACVRLLARIVPFIAAAVEEEEDPSDDPTRDEPADVRRISRALWGESEDAPLAPPLPWRRHSALTHAEERSSSSARAEEIESRGDRVEEAESTQGSRAGDVAEELGSIRLASVGERLLALFCDLLFCPGFTTPLPEACSDAGTRSGAFFSWREAAAQTSAAKSSTSANDTASSRFTTSVSYARTSYRASNADVSSRLDNHTTALALATRRREVLRLLLAMAASEAMYTPPRCVTRTRRFLEALGGGAAEGEPRREDDAATKKMNFVRAGTPTTRRDVFRALMDSIAPTPKTYVFGAASPALALARDEQRTTAVHCLLTLLDYERKPKSQKSKPAEDVASSSSAAAEPVGALAAASTASWFQWLDDLLGGLWGPPGAPGAAAAAARASSASSFSLFGSMDWLAGPAGLAEEPRLENSSETRAAFPPTPRQKPNPTRRAVVAPDGSVVAVDAGETSDDEQQTTRGRLNAHTSSSANDENAYASALASFSDHAFLHDALLSIFRAAVHHDSDLSGVSDKGAPCFEEAAALFLHASRANEAFFEFCVSEEGSRGLPLVFHLLGLAVRHRGALDKGGFVQCASFAALRVSSSAAFAKALAASARDPAAHPELELFRDPSLDDPVPAPTAVAEDASFETAVTEAISSGVAIIGDGINGIAEGFSGLVGLESETSKTNMSTWRGTHLDAFVYAAYALLTETSRSTSSAVANPLLVAVRNVAPFAGKNALSRGSCERLCRLVERYASHALLFAQPDAYEDHVRTLAEATHALDACARARGDDEALVASIQKSKDVFERLDAMGAESDDEGEELSEDGDSSNLSSSDGDSSDLDSDADVPFSETTRRTPSREWLRAIRSRLSLDATLRLARRDGEGGGARDANAATVRTATVRRFTGASPEVRKWLRGYALGLVLLRETQTAEGDMSRTFAPLFDAKRVRLFRVTRVRRRKDSFS